MKVYTVTFADGASLYDTADSINDAIAKARDHTRMCDYDGCRVTPGADIVAVMLVTHPDPDPTPAPEEE